MLNKIQNHKLFLIITLLLVSCIILNTINIWAQTGSTMDKLQILQHLLHSEMTNNSFYDISNHWAEDSMKNLNYMEILKGFPDNSMKPSKTITRAEFVTMLVRAVDMPITDTYIKYYNDIDTSSWSYYHVSAAKKSGIIDVFSEADFYPDKVITREEMAVIAAMVTAAVPLPASSIAFKDIDKSYKYADSITRTSSLGIIKGFPDGKFNPYGNASRAEAAIIIQRVLDVRDFSIEPSDSTIIDIAKEYEMNLLEASNQEDYIFRLLLNMSMGKERALNQIRAAEIKNIVSSGIQITRTPNNLSARVNKKSIYLAEVTLSYNLKVENGLLEKNYDVDKSIFLKKKGTRWLVYNSSLNNEYLNITPKLESKSSKINLVWQYMHSSTPNMTGSPAIEGLNVISPTWFTLSSGSGDIKSIADANYSKWAKGRGYKLWALVTNDFDKEMTSQMLNNSAARKKAIDALLLYAEWFQLDGINVDFENMYIKDKNVFTQFVKELYQRATVKNLIISVDVTVIAANSNWSECYDRAELAKVSDYIMLMAYDQYWAGSSISGSVAQITWVEQNLIKVLKEVPKEKLILGLPFYTRIWKEVYSPVEKKTLVTSKAVSMETAEQAIAENKAAKVWDEKSGQYYASYTKDGAVYKIWLEDERSIKLKTELANKYNLAGIASWRLGFERPVIWKVINDTLK